MSDELRTAIIPPEEQIDVAVRLQDVSVSFDQETVVEEVSISFPRGKCTVIMGPSGSGKSTMLKTAAGLIEPSDGRVTILGKDVARLGDRELRELRRSNGFVFQDAALWQNLSLMQNLSLPLRYHFRGLAEDEIEAKVARITRELGRTVRLTLRPAQVSAGERKMFSLARALMTEPELVYLDEPTTSVDGEAVEILIRKLKELKSANITLIAVTHDARIASRLADYVLVLKAGRILEFGSLREVTRSTNPDVSRILTDVLSETATYDGDILELLDSDEGSLL